MKLLSNPKLRPTLVLGSGFHRHVFSYTENQSVRPLYDWHYLLHEVASRMRVAIPDRVLSPIQRWDTLILRAAKEGFRNAKKAWVEPRSLQAYVIEKEARRVVASILNEASEDYSKSTRAELPLLDCWGAVISLNFDAAWLPKTKQVRFPRPQNIEVPSQKVSGREKRRLTNYLLMSGVDGGAHRRVWFPNGTCVTPETIRMGLHDYGAAANGIQVAFSHLKKWEQASGVTGEAPQEQLAACTHALRRASEAVNDLSDILGHQPLPLTWVADFVYRPLVFAGLGMSDQESGLWWLLAQRARNLARTGVPSNAYILVDANDRPAFWKNKPLGLEAIACSNWDEGWERVVQTARDFVVE